MAINPANVAAAGSNLPRCSVRYTAGAAQGSGYVGALAMYQGCAAVPGTQAIRFCGSAELWPGAFADYLVWQSYNHFGTPNQVNCTNNSDPTDHNTIWAGYYVTAMGSAPPSSQHPGGVNLGLADGSVRFIKNTVAPNTWWALGNEALNERRELVLRGTHHVVIDRRGFVPHCLQGLAQLCQQPRASGGIRENARRRDGVDRGLERGGRCAHAATPIVDGSGPASSPGPVWNSTVSPVSCMNACSSEACIGVSSASTICSASAISPISCPVRP